MKVLIQILARLPNGSLKWRKEGYHQSSAVRSENPIREKLSAGESVLDGVIVVGPHAANGGGGLCWRCTTIARTDHQGDVTRRGQHRDPRYVDREGGGQSAAR